MLTRAQATQRKMRELYRREVLEKVESAPVEELPELPSELLEEPLLAEADVEALLEEKLREAPPAIPEGGYGTTRFFKAGGQ